MHPAPSIIFFTVASGAGYGLLFLLGLAAPLGLIPSERWLGLAGMALALGAITLGLLASTLHLGHPERAWRAVTQWRTSWLSREGVMALITYAPALVFGFGWVALERTGGWFALLGVLSAAGAVLTVGCTAMIYASLKPVRAWRHPLVPPVYLTLALMTGALVCHALLAAFGLPRALAGWLALLATIAGLGLKAGYWRAVADERGASTPESATGLGELGLVRLLDPPHTETNYLLDEMGYRVARKHAGRLRRLGYALAFVAPALLTVLALLATGLLATTLAWLAALLGLAGVLIERWLFFAEAKHTVTLYYGSRAA
ncbi:MAG: dimethyl sulfoxide reductase anchor subunit family protein [Geminicoccales bacterium]